jgi:hypothetical protein
MYMKINTISRQKWRYQKPFLTQSTHATLRIILLITIVYSQHSKVFIFPKTCILALILNLIHLFLSNINVCSYIQKYHMSALLEQKKVYS